MRLDLKRVPKMVGDNAKKKFYESLEVLRRTNWPLYFVGPSGSGKTLIAMNLAKAYAMENNVPAYYAQLSPDQTKTSLILGLRLVNGTLKPVKGMVADAMEKGGIVVIDEATHTTQELLLMFNSILDRTSVTSIGDEIVYAKDTFRMIFCSNDSRYAGNVKLPQSFAQRLVTTRFDYPNIEDEIKIAMKMAKSEYSGEISAPKSVARYLVSFIRDVRNDEFPLSVRNAAIALIRLQIAFDLEPEITQKELEERIAEYFQGQNAESTRRNIANRVLGKDVISTDLLNSIEVREFIFFIGVIGVKRFKDIVLGSCMYYLDVDGLDISNDVIKNKIDSMLI